MIRGVREPRFDCIIIRVKYPLFLSDLNETLIFWTDFRKIIKFQENPPSGSRIVPRGRTDVRTDGRDECNSRFSQFCERA